MVNGYPCKDWTDVSNAKKHIDPKHPKDGTYGVNAKSDPTNPVYGRDTAVIFSGVVQPDGQSGDGRTPCLRPDGCRLRPPKATTAADAADRRPGRFRRLR